MMHHKCKSRNAHESNYVSKLEGSPVKLWACGDVLKHRGESFNRETTINER